MEINVLLSFLPPLLPCHLFPPLSNTNLSISKVLSPIGQLDGIADLSFSSNSSVQHLPPPSSGGDSLGGSGAANLRVAPYNLNREKQVSKLVSDTRLEDYEIVVSPTEQNINVHCSTGFYSLVVLPAFSEIFVGYTTTTSNISLHCYDITG